MPAAKREAVQHLQQQHGFSQRRACRTTNCNRKTAGHSSQRPEDTQLRERLKALAQEKLRWGYKMLAGALRQEGLRVNHKKVYRLYKEEKLELRRKGKKRLKSELRGQPEHPTAPCQLWTMDFVSDALSDGRSFRSLNLVDAFTRQCLAIETDTSLGVSAWCESSIRCWLGGACRRFFRLIMARSSAARHWMYGLQRTRSSCTLSNRANQHRTA